MVFVLSLKTLRGTVAVIAESMYLTASIQGTSLIPSVQDGRQWPLADNYSNRLPIGALSLCAVLALY